MKRSEAIEQIERYMNSDHTASAENLLTFLEEKLGMAPPFSFDVFLKQKNRWGIESANGREWTEELEPLEQWKDNENKKGSR